MLNLSSSWRTGAPLRAILLSQVAVSALLSMGGEAAAAQNDPTTFTSLTVSGGVVVDPSSVQSGVGAVYSVPLSAILPTQMNVGDSEIAAHVASDNLDTQAEFNAEVQGEIEPVVIGPGGAIYVTDGHHTFAAFAASNFANTNVDVNVIANYSGLTQQQFVQAMENGTLYPVNNGVPQPLNLSSTTPGISPPLPTSLSGLTDDPYRGLAYNVLKNPGSGAMTIPTSSGTVTVNYTGTGYAKTADEFSDFIWANAFRNANGGIGLPDVSPADANNAAAYAQNGSNATTITGVTNSSSTATTTSVQINQLPGYILPTSMTLGQQITNNTLNNNGASPTNMALSGSGAFNGINGLFLNEGGGNVLTIEAAQPGFVMQLGNNDGAQVTLTNTANNFTGGVYIAAGTLATAFGGGADALGAAATGGTINLSTGNTNVMSSVQSENGIVFNSLSEGAGTLTFGTNTTGGTSFTENRNIAVGQESATINTNGNTITLTGQIATSNLAPAGYADLVLNDAASTPGTLILNPTASQGNSGFFGNFDIASGTLKVMSNNAFGNTDPTKAGGTTSQIELDDGTFQTGASLTSTGTDFFLHGSRSTIDLSGGNASSFGTLTDTQRELKVINSAAGNGSIGFTQTIIGTGATADISLGSSTGNVSVNLGNITNAVTADSGSSAIGTLVLAPHGTLGSASEKIFASSVSNTSTVSSAGSVTITNGIVSPWIITDNGAGANSDPYNFVSYSSSKGFTAFAGYATNSFSSGSVVMTTGSVSTGTASAYALNVQAGSTLTVGNGDTLTIGDGTNPAGLIIQNGTITGSTGTLAFGGSQGVIFAKGASAEIDTSLSGSGGLVIAGSGTLTMTGMDNNTGGITIESGTLQLNTADEVGNAGSITLSQNNSKVIGNANLNVNANESIGQLNSGGDNSIITIASGTTLTVGSGSIQSTVSGSGGTLIKSGSGLFDISGVDAGSFAIGTGSANDVQVTGGQLRIASGIFANTATGINLAGGTELQFAQGGGGSSSNPISGAGDVRLVGGNLQLAGTNTYTGGTYIEYGGTLQTSTGSMPLNGNVYSSGLLVFDQDNSGTFGGIIGDGKSMIGTNGPGSVVVDDSVGSNGNVTFSQAQTYTGSTTVESGTLTLGTGNAIMTSGSLVLGQLGGSTTGTTSSGVVLEANNTVNNLTSVQGSTTNVALNGNTLTVDGGANINGTMSITGGTTTFSNGATLANGGALKTDPATMNVIGDLTIGSGSYLSAAPGDVYNVTGSFLNSSTSSLWNTSGATLQFSGGSSSMTVDHVYDLTSPDEGSEVPTNSVPFSWGELELGTTGAPDPFDELTLESGIPGDSDLALYVGELLGLVFNGDEVTNLLDPGGFNVYYSTGDNPELDGQTFQLAGGGELIASVPEPGSLSALLSGMVGLAWFRLAPREKRGEGGISPTRARAGSPAAHLHPP